MNPLALAPVWAPLRRVNAFPRGWLCASVEVSLLARLRFNKYQVFYRFHSLAVCNSTELARCSSVRVYS
jgi:hypothetical protein